MRTITITVEDGGSGFDVHEDGKCCDGLCWDEMLGQVALMTVPPARVRNGYAMHTPQEWAEIRGERSRKLEPPPEDPRPF